MAAADDTWDIRKGYVAELRTRMTKVEEPLALPPPSPSGGVPTSYLGLTDRRLRIEPPLPPMGPRGSIISDPTFGNRIFRVTDGMLVPERPNRAWYANDGSAEAIQWNADSTRFLVVGAGGEFLVFDLNRTAFSATRRAMPGGAWYLPVSNPVWDPMGDNRRLAGYIGNQDTATIVVAKDLSTDWIWKLDTQVGTINGTHLPNWLPFGVHNTRMGQDGRYLVISVGSGSTPSGIAVWDLDVGTIGWCRVRCGGHKVSAYGILLNNDNLPGGTYLGYQMLKRRVSMLASPTQLIPLPSRPVRGTDSHYSWGNAQSAALVPLIASSTGEGLGDRLGSGDHRHRDRWLRHRLALGSPPVPLPWLL